MQLNLVAPINKVSYGYASINILKELDKLGVEVSLFPLNLERIDVDSEEDKAIVQKCMNYAKFYNVNAPSLKIWHQNELSLIGNGKKFALSFWEMDRFDQLELHHLNSVDHVLVTSEWGKEILQSAGIETVDVIPLGVDRNVFKTDLPDNAEIIKLFKSPSAFKVHL